MWKPHEDQPYRQASAVGVVSRSPRLPAILPRRANPPRPPTPVSKAEIKSWLERAKELPDIRWDKVQAMRDAVRNRTIDADDRLSRLADRLPAELIEYLRQTGE